MDFPSGSDSKEYACNAGDLGLIPGSGRPLGKGMAVHSSVPYWLEGDIPQWCFLLLMCEIENLVLYLRVICLSVCSCYLTFFPH